MSRSLNLCSFHSSMTKTAIISGAKLIVAANSSLLSYDNKHVRHTSVGLCMIVFHLWSADIPSSSHAASGTPSIDSPCQN